MEHVQRGWRAIHIFGIPAESLVQSLINGLALGWIYILIALGLSLIRGIMGTVKFTQREYGNDTH